MTVGEHVNLASLDSWGKRTNINEAVIVVLVRLRGLGVREWNVVTTVVITTEASVSIEAYRWLLANTILRLHNTAIDSRESHGKILRLFCEDSLSSSARARFINVEEALHFFLDDRELALHFRLLETAKIVISEDLDILVLLLLGEHGINKEDWREEELFLSFRVNGLLIGLVHVDGNSLVRTSEYRISLTLLGVADRLEDELVALANLGLNLLALFALVLRSSKVRLLPFDDFTLRLGLDGDRDNLLLRVAERSVLHESSAEISSLSLSLGGQNHRDNGRENELLHSCYFL